MLSEEQWMMLAPLFPEPEWRRDLGIIKVDLLGLGMMAVLEDWRELIPKHYGEEIDFAQLPADDPAV